MRKSILTNWWLSDSVGVVYNSYVTDYVNQIITEGYTMPDSTRLLAINDLTTTISNILAKADYYHLYALNNAALSNAASLNLINPLAHQAVYVNSPTYGIRGVRTNGTTSYVDLNYNGTAGSVNYTLNSASRAVFIETAPTTGVFFDGIASISSRNCMRADSSINQRINSTNPLNIAVNLSGLGYTAINRSDSTNVQLYKGTTKTDRTQTSTGLESDNQLLGRSGTFYSDSEYGFDIGAASLTEAEHNLLRSAYLTYKTAIGL